MADELGISTVGEREWPPTSPNVTFSKAFVRDLRDKTGMKIDYPESHGGTKFSGFCLFVCLFVRNCLRNWPEPQT